MENEYTELAKILRREGELGYHHTHPLRALLEPTRAEMIAGKHDKLPPTPENVPKLLELAQHVMDRCASIGVDRPWCYRDHRGVPRGRLPELAEQLAAGCVKWHQHLEERVRQLQAQRAAEQAEQTRKEAAQAEMKRILDETKAREQASKKTAKVA